MNRRYRRNREGCEVIVDRLPGPDGSLSHLGVFDASYNLDVGSGDARVRFAASHDQRHESPFIGRATRLIDQLSEPKHYRLGQDVHRTVRVVERDPTDLGGVDLEGWRRAACHRGSCARGGIFTTIGNRGAKGSRPGALKAPGRLKPFFPAWSKA